MPALTTEDLAARTDQLPDDAYYYLMRTLRTALPAPPTDDADDLRRRDSAAIARVAGLVPANAAEADIAALHVIASEQAKECFRLAQLPETPSKQAMQCRNQANAMMRQAQGALRLLLRMQAVREKREATNQSCDRAAFTEQCAINLMLEAVAPPSNREAPLSDPPATQEQAARPDTATLPAPAAKPDDGHDTHRRIQPERDDQPRPPSTRGPRLVPNGISLDLPAAAGFRPS